ncbi:MAG: hypothetical protein IPM21_03055 [Acidobacteria bacterium]|nr:hypothetical protein [Acidobacteriota bacterium]
MERRAAERAAIARQNAEAAMATAPGTLYGGIMSGLGSELVPMFDAATNAMLTFQQAAPDGSPGRQCVCRGCSAEWSTVWFKWAWHGSQRANSRRRQLCRCSATAFSIATQAAIKAVFEAAESVAAYAR